eukprot:PhM_4_TR5230/c0_g1_i3/m.786
MDPRWAMHSTAPAARPGYGLLQPLEGHQHRRRSATRRRSGGGNAVPSDFSPYPTCRLCGTFETFCPATGQRHYAARNTHWFPTYTDYDYTPPKLPDLPPPPVEREPEPEPVVEARFIDDESPIDWNPTTTEAKSGVAKTILDEIYEAATLQEPSRATALYAIIKLVGYVIFLGILTASVLSDRVTNHSYFLYSSISNALAEDTYGGVNSKEAAVEYIRDVVAVKFLDGYTEWEGTLVLSEPRIFSSLIPLSTIRLRQQQVVPGCSRDAWQDAYSPCHPPIVENNPWDTTGEIRKSVLPGTFPHPNVGVYNTPQSLCPFKEMCETEQSADISSTSAPPVPVPPGGYIYDMNLTWALERMKEIASKKNNTLEESDFQTIAAEAYNWILETSWISQDTRILIVEFTMVTANFERPFYVMPTIAFHFPAAGGVNKAFDVLPLLLSSSASVLEIALVALSCVILFMYCARIVKRALMPVPCVKCIMFRYREYLVGKAWYKCVEPTCPASFDRRITDNCPNCGTAERQWMHTCFWGAIRDINMGQTVVNMGLLLGAFFIRLQVRNAFQERVDVLEKGIGTFLDLRPIQQRMSLTFSLNAVNLILTFFGLLTHVRHFESFGKYLRLFGHGAVMVLTFLATFGVAFVGFSIAMHLSFGSQGNNFEDINGSMLNAFRIMLGDMGFGDLAGDSVVLNYFLYTVFCVTVIIVALNVFVSIVTFAFQEATRLKPDNIVRNSFFLIKRDIKRAIRIWRGRPPERVPVKVKEELPNKGEVSKLQELKALVTELTLAMKQQETRRELQHNTQQ